MEYRRVLFRSDRTRRRSGRPQHDEVSERPQRFDRRRRDRDARRGHRVGQNSGEPGVGEWSTDVCSSDLIALGADLVVPSTTKYLNGHSDWIGGVVIATRDEDIEWL